MTKLIYVTSIVIINTCLQVTYAQPQNSNAGNRVNSIGNYGHPEPQRINEISNFGNGDYKHNIINVDENSNSVSVQGASYGVDPNGRPTLNNVNLHLNNAARPAHVSNIGNGVGNRNVFVLNDNRQGQPGPQPRSRRPNNGVQPGEILLNANIGRGPQNDNRIYVNDRRVDLNPINAGDYPTDPGLQNRQDTITSTIYDATRYANNYGNGVDNKNIIRINDDRTTDGGRGVYTQNIPQKTNIAEERTTQISDFGNSEHKHNIINVDESNSDSVHGVSYGIDPNVNVDLNDATRPKYNSYIGNGVGNRNVVLFNDNRQGQTRTQPWSRQPNNGVQPGEILLNANIGRGPQNNNRIYVNGKRIDLDPYAESGSENKAPNTKLYYIVFTMGIITLL